MQISKYCNLSSEFIEKFSHRLNWHKLSEYSELEEDVIRKFESEVDWNPYQDTKIYQKNSYYVEFSQKINFRALLRSEYAPSQDFIAELLERAYH